MKTLADIQADFEGIVCRMRTRLLPALVGTDCTRRMWALLFIGAAANRGG